MVNIKIQRNKLLPLQDKICSETSRGFKTSKWKYWDNVKWDMFSEINTCTNFGRALECPRLLFQSIKKESVNIIQSWYTNIHIVHHVGFISLLLLFEPSGWRLNSKSGLDRSILPDLASAPMGEGFNKRNQDHLRMNTALSTGDKTIILG